MRVLVLLVLVVAPGCHTTSSSRDTQSIEDVVHAQEAAWNRGDAAAFMTAGYWRSPELSFFSGGEVTHGFDPVLAHYVERYKSSGAEMGKLAFSRVDVLPLSTDSAIVRGRWDLDFARQDDVGGLFTLVFRKLEEGWRIVHDHTSVDAPKKGAP